MLRMFLQDVSDWRRGWFFYIEKKISRFAIQFESKKTILVDLLIARRGGNQRPFLRVSLLFLLAVGILSAPVLARSYPGALPSGLENFTPPSAVLQTLNLSDYGVQTQVSAKPRDQIITYAVQSGDTLATIARKFDVSVESIKWAGDLSSDELSIGQELKIPPVSGIVHKVHEGETIYSIAKKYKTDAQKIVNFPFNDFADLDTFALTVGQTLIVPDGVMPEAPAYIATPPAFVGKPIASGRLLWPTNGIITQYPVWYHMAFDIANPTAPGVMAAEAGVVTFTGFMRFGYGNYIMVDHGGGLSTLYAHLSEYYVKAGDRVARGQVIGRMGSTGRSTGTHLHFETRMNNVPVNPGQYFQ